MRKILASVCLFENERNPLASRRTDELLDIIHENHAPTFHDRRKGKRTPDESAALELAHRVHAEPRIVDALLWNIRQQSGKVQKISLWILLYAQHDPRVREFLARHFADGFLHYAKLHGAAVHDQQGREYRVRVKEFPGSAVYVGIDAPHSIPVGRQFWNLAGGMPGKTRECVPWGQMGATPQTVAYTIYFYGAPMSVLSDDRLTMSNLQTWLLIATRYASETLPAFQRKGLFRALTRQWAGMAPVGTELVIPIAEPGQVRLLIGGAHFDQTIWGKAFQRTGFKITNLRLIDLGDIDPQVLAYLKKEAA